LTTWSPPGLVSPAAVSCEVGAHNSWSKVFVCLVCECLAAENAVLYIAAERKTFACLLKAPGLAETIAIRFRDQWRTKLTEQCDNPQDGPLGASHRSSHVVGIRASACGDCPCDGCKEDGQFQDGHDCSNSSVLIRHATWLARRGSLRPRNAHPPYRMLPVPGVRGVYRIRADFRDRVRTRCAFSTSPVPVGPSLLDRLAGFTNLFGAWRVLLNFLGPHLADCFSHLRVGSLKHCGRRPGFAILPKNTISIQPIGHLPVRMARQHECVDNLSNFRGKRLSG